MRQDHPEVNQIPYLETFSKAAELSHFTAAADALQITQAAVSQRIRALEEDLGVSLFDRKAGKVFLTEPGQRLYEFAQKILALHQEARQAVTGKRAPVGGELALAASSIPGEHLLPAILSEFHQRHPHIKVAAAVADTSAVLQQVEQGQVSLGLVGGKSDSPHLEYRPFAVDHLVVVVRPDHPWAKRDHVTLKQFMEHPLIVREAGSGSRWCMEQALNQAGRSPHDLNIAMQLGSNEAIKEAVLRGNAAAVLSCFAVQRDRDAGKLHALKVAGLPMEREIMVVTDKRRVLPIPARIFLDFLESPAAKRLSEC